jgi:hypothetical protein
VFTVVKKWCVALGVYYSEEVESNNTCELTWRDGAACKKRMNGRPLLLLCWVKCLSKLDCNVNTSPHILYRGKG